MTSTRQKLRGLTLAVLMVTSVFAGTIALTGTAAAATNGDFGQNLGGSNQLTTGNVPAGETGSVAATVAVSDTEQGTLGDNFQNIKLSFNDNAFQGAFPSGSSDANVDVYVDGTQVAGGGSNSASVAQNSNGGKTVTLQMGSSVSFTDGDDGNSDVVSVVLQDDFTAPGTTGDYTGTINVAPNNDNAGIDTGTLTVGPSSTDEVDVDDALEFKDPEASDSKDDFVQVTFDRTKSDVSTSNFEYEIEDRDGTVYTNSEIDTVTSTSNVRSVILVIDDSSDVDLSGDAEIRVSSNDGDFEDDIDGSGDITTTSATIKEGVDLKPGTVDEVVYRGGQVAVVGDYADGGTYLPASATGSGEIINTQEEYEFSNTSLNDSDQYSSTSTIFGGTTGPTAWAASEDSDQFESGAVYNVELQGDQNGNTDDSTQTHQLEVRNLGLSIEADDTSLNFREGESTTIEGTASAKFANRDVEIELLDDSGDTVSSTNTSIDGDREVDVSFDVTEEGDYTLNVTDIASGVEAGSDTIAVEEVDGDASFANKIYQQESGDRVNITIDMENVETADVTFGSSDVSYVNTFTVTDGGADDGDTDGQVTITVNTVGPDFSVQNSDDDSIDLSGGQSGVTEDTSAANPLDTADYDLNVSLAGEETDVATLSVEPSEVNAVDIGTAPGSEFSDMDTLGGIQESNVTFRRQTAQNDVLVQRIDASGIYGVLNATAEQNNEDLEEALISLNADVEFDLETVQTNPEANADPKVLDLAATNNADALEVVADDQNNTLYVVVDEENAVFGTTSQNDVRRNFASSDTSGSRAGELSPTGTTSAEDDDRFNTTLRIGIDDINTGDLPSAITPLDLADTPKSASGTSQVVERDAEFDAEEERNEEPLYVVEAAAGQTINGDTSVAPGTELSVRARATGDNPFLLTQELVVTENGTFSGQYDFSDVASNQNFTLSIPQQNFEDPDNAETNGFVEAAATADVTLNNQTFTGQATEVTVANATLSEGGFVTIHDSTLLDGATFDSVRGTSAYLEPGTETNVSITLDDPVTSEESGDTFFAMPHFDTDDDETYDFVTSEGADDGPYTTASGDIVLDGGVINVTQVATVTFNDQQTNGNYAVVSSARLPDGGFVTIHDDTVADDPFGSVRGTSAYLEPGRTSDINVTLDDTASETGQFFAMPHRDTDSDEEYDFVSSNGDDDGPYLNADGAIVLDGATLNVGGMTAPSASVTFNDQTLEDGSVTVASATLSEGGFVTIHDSTVADDPLGSVAGTSDFLSSGTSEDVEVEVDISESGQFFAMPHLDTNGNEEYDFVSSEGSADGPYTTSEGDIVLVSAQITVETETPTPTDTPTETPTETDDETPTQTTSGGQPGFGLAVSLIALIGAALIALRRRD
jgi:surface glycoprotein (TIGR04207 family)/PGF-CTERM protein